MVVRCQPSFFCTSDHESCKLSMLSANSNCHGQAVVYCSDQKKKSSCNPSFWCQKKANFDLLLCVPSFQAIFYGFSHSLKVLSVYRNGVLGCTNHLHLFWQADQSLVCGAARDWFTSTVVYWHLRTSNHLVRPPIPDEDMFSIEESPPSGVWLASEKERCFCSADKL